MTEESDVDRLAALAGVLPGYTDQAGRSVETSEEAKRAVLDALGFPTDATADIDDGLARLRALHEGPVARLIACDAGAPVVINLNDAPRPRLRWSVVEENGTCWNGEANEWQLNLFLPPLSAGYHRLLTESEGTRRRALLVAAPPRCWRPEQLTDRRGFGVTTQVYGLRSNRQFGIGDYTDVGAMAAGAARWGASFLGLSPTHALFPADPPRFSPYSPSSRLFLQTTLIDPTSVAEESSAVLTDLIDHEGLGDQLEYLRQGTLIDYAGVLSLKNVLFEAMWKRFGGDAGSDFTAFRRARGAALERHALFDALSEHFAAQGALNLSVWPAAFQSPDSPSTAQFLRDHPERIAYYAWLQWLADRQLSAAHARARDAGMEIGLYRDLAVGPDRAGSEVWSAPSLYVTRLSIGAPPDALGPQGQNWELAPFDPLALVERELLPFRDLVAANMRHAGALRIDHAFQLRRLFLIPSGANAELGAYVSYPCELLLAVLRIESHRAKCLVIAEDLGTSPPGFSEVLMRSGVFSLRILSFERDQSGAFRAPQAYPRESLAATASHDLPTFAGWRRGQDIDARERFGIFDADQARMERSARRADRLRFDEALRRENLPVFGSDGDDAASFESCLRYLARTSSALLAVQVEDVIGEIQQANLPGAPTGHPNWRRRLSATIEEIVAPTGPLAKSAATLAREGRGLRDSRRQLAAAAPRATYRIQFNKSFTFADAIPIIPRLRALGISHVYASPILMARPGSTHGYDVVDYAQINPDLGGMPDFMRFSDALRAQDIGLIVDFTPNHMGAASPQNRWWTSVLEWGSASPHAKTFDIDWRRPGADGRLVLPFLNKSVARTLEDSEITLAFEAESGALSFIHFDQSFPLRPDVYPELLQLALPEPRADSDLIKPLIERFQSLSGLQSEFLLDATETAKRSLATAIGERPTLGRALESVAGRFDPRDKSSNYALKELLERQHYRLVSWKLASSKINYRRFFDISTLVGVRVEDEETFDRMHELVFSLIRENRIQGLRIDHIDGLVDPQTYLERLQRAVGPGFFIIVEKILGPGEVLRDWPIAGTTGYEAGAALDQLFVNREHCSDFDACYEQATGDKVAYEDQLFDIKSMILTDSFGVELQNLVGDLERLTAAQPDSRNLSREMLQRALIALVAAFPVYRTYKRNAPDEHDRATLIRARAQAAHRLVAGQDRALEFVIKQLAANSLDPICKDFSDRFQQLTGPVMAKGQEDTLFYRYGRLIALNEVGADPTRFGGDFDVFHAAMAARARKWPAALTATSTHDSKRGEDARARLLAMTASPAAWREGYAIFCDAINAFEERPDDRDAYFLYQSLLAALPVELMRMQPTAAECAAFLQRAKQFATKALRESKRNTSWTEPNEAYEGTVARALDALLAPDGAFLEKIAPLARDAAFGGALCSLARTVLKCALPGVPDFYQGAEFWNNSFVDPDNRRPVDRMVPPRALNARDGPENMLRNWRNGRIKQFVTARMLADRATSPDLYAFGDYSPIAIEGDNPLRPIGFERRHGKEALVVMAATRFARGEDCPGKVPSGARFALAPGHWRNLLSGETLLSSGSMNVREALSHWPALALKTIH